MGSFGWQRAELSVTGQKSTSSAADRLLCRSISLAGLIAVRRFAIRSLAAASSRAVTEMIKEGVLARQVESWSSSIRLLSDAVVVDALRRLQQLSDLGRRAHHV